jgi:hypothetical protein
MQQKEKLLKQTKIAIKTSKRISNATNKNMKCNIKKVYCNIQNTSTAT